MKQKRNKVKVPFDRIAHLAKIREIKAQKRQLALDIKSGKVVVASGKPSNITIPLEIKNPGDLKKASKLFIEDLINQQGKFSTAQSRMLKDLADIYFKADEYATLKQSLRTEQTAITQGRARKNKNTETS